VLGDCRRTLGAMSPVRTEQGVQQLQLNSCRFFPLFCSFFILFAFIVCFLYFALLLSYLFLLCFGGFPSCLSKAIYFYCYGRRTEIYALTIPIFIRLFTNNHIDIIRKGNAYFMTKFIKSDFLWIPFLIYVWEQGAKLTGQIKLWFISLQNPSSTGWTRILRKLHAKHTRLVDGYKCIYVYTDVYII